MNPARELYDAARTLLAIDALLIAVVWLAR
jgi:hypothetical protein